MILCSLALPALHYPCLAGLRHHTFTIQAAPLLAFDSTASQGCTSFSNSVLPSVCPASENDNWAREEQSWNPPFLTPAPAGPSTNPARWAEWKPHPNVCVLVRELALEARDDVPPPPRPDHSTFLPLLCSPSWARHEGQSHRGFLCTNVPHPYVAFLCFQPSIHGHRIWLYSAEPLEGVHTKRRKSKKVPRSQGRLARPGKF